MPFDQVDVIFFCFGNGKSEAFLKEHNVPAVRTLSSRPTPMMQTIAGMPQIKLLTA